MQSNKFIPLNHVFLSDEEMLQRSGAFFQMMNSRRSVRSFSRKSVPKTVVENIIKSASTAPSGAHKQPWTFCLISSQEMKTKIREAAEKEEYISYNGRMSDEWLKDLEPFGTDFNKPFIEDAPWIIVVCKKNYDLKNDGGKAKNYYVNESVGIAVGILLVAIHQAGLCSLTHTPSPMKFLTQILDRPDNERPFLLIPVGLPAEGVQVPDLKRKELKEVLTEY